jgi:hypothetical protein
MKGGRRAEADTQRRPDLEPAARVNISDWEAGKPWKSGPQTWCLLRSHVTQRPWGQCSHGLWTSEPQANQWLAAFLSQAMACGLAGA